VEEPADRLVFGQRIKHLRRSRKLTLEQLGQRLGRPASFLSMVENGKRRVRPEMVTALAAALEVEPDVLLEETPPNRRAELEIEVERIQQDPIYQSLGLPYLKPGVRVPDDAMTHLVALYRALQERVRVRPETQEEVRVAAATMLADARNRDGYLVDVEIVAAKALAFAGYQGSGALSPRHLQDLAAGFGFAVKLASDLPRSVRSVVDLDSGRIFIPQRDALRTRAARSVVLQTLGHVALNHDTPTDFGAFLRQRMECSYFAAAVLIPEGAAVPFLDEARRRRDLAVEDLKEVFYVSYETAARRLTNLATHHLGIPTHFINSDEDGLIWKGYENDGFPFAHDPYGGVEGQRACRHWGARAVFGSEDKFGVHFQYTDTPAGTFWCSTHIPADRTPHHGITLGTDFDHARFFRGRETDRHSRSGCPEPGCCMTLATELTERWAGSVWASSRAQSNVVTALTASPIPQIEMAEVYEFVERHA
jgi:XRE family transcriptional regulator, fatty acid utilization regulator